MHRLPTILRPPPGAVAAWDRSAAAVRRAARHHRRLGHLAALIAVLAGAWAGWSALAEAGDARDRWGHTVPVVVADVALAPGDRADAGSVSMRAWPAALAPPSALHAIPDAVVRQRVGAGEALGSADVGSVAGTAGMLATEEVAVAIPIEQSRRPTLATGDRVGVVVGDQRTASGTVLEVDASTVVVAVPSDRAATIAAATINDSVVLLLEP